MKEAKKGKCQKCGLCFYIHAHHILPKSVFVNITENLMNGKKKVRLGILRKTPISLVQKNFFRHAFKSYKDKSVKSFWYLTDLSSAIQINVLLKRFSACARLDSDRFIVNIFENIGDKISIQVHFLSPFGSSLEYFEPSIDLESSDIFFVFEIA